MCCQVVDLYRIRGKSTCREVELCVYSPPDHHIVWDTQFQFNEDFRLIDIVYTSTTARQGLNTPNALLRREQWMKAFDATHRLTLTYFSLICLRMRLYLLAGIRLVNSGCSVASHGWSRASCTVSRRLHTRGHTSVAASSPPPSKTEHSSLAIYTRPRIALATAKTAIFYSCYCRTQWTA